tara:strand:+ start:1590 stop:1805 length:216 start_codon:yes stop_codon:yes gene_type:complete
MQKTKFSPVLISYLFSLHQLSGKGLTPSNRATIQNEAATMAERLTDAEIKAAQLAADLMAEFIAVQKKLAN